MKYICLEIDYRNFTIDWWDWSDKDKEGTTFSLFTGKTALYTNYKIKNTIFDIYKTLITDIWANEKVLKDIKENIIYFGEKMKMLLNEKMIFIRSLWDNKDWTVYKQNMEKGELELL